jgi:hypothetical protein
MTMHVINLLEELDFSSIFNVSDSYMDNAGPNDELDYAEEAARKKQLPNKRREEIERVVDTLRTTWAGNHKLYFVKWKGLPYSDNTWINEKELMKSNGSNLPGIKSLNQEVQDFFFKGRMMHVHASERNIKPTLFL